MRSLLPTAFCLLFALTGCATTDPPYVNHFGNAHGDGDQGDGDGEDDDSGDGDGDEDPDNGKPNTGDGDGDDSDTDGDPGDNVDGGVAPGHVDAGTDDPGDGPDKSDWNDRKDLGVGDGSDVVTIGDSWMANSLGTGDAIEGALGRLNKKYQNHGVQGVMMLSASLFGAAIPTQFDDAVFRNKDIKTVIMTGGGNDIIQTAGLQDDCKKGGDACKKKLAEIADAMKKLWAKMAAAGVQDVVYIGYSKDAGSSGEMASNPAMNGIEKVCDEATLFCHIIDSTPLVNKELILDGIHPTQAANDRMGKAILMLMEQRKVRR